MRDDISRMCPGKKKIVLASETSLKTRFFTFALLQSKWCMPVGVAGSHNVCVCTNHQNVKVMLSTAKTSLIKRM